MNEYVFMKKRSNIKPARDLEQPLEAHVRQNAKASLGGRSKAAGLQRVSQGCYVCTAVVVFCTVVLWLRGPISLDRGIQCVFKAYYPIDNFVKSRRTYESLTEVIADNSGGGWSSATMPTDKATSHDYLKVYDILLAPYQKKGAVSLLEIGVKKGGSMQLFREYFSHDSRIYGVDIDPTVTSFPRDIGMKTLVFNSRDQIAARNSLGTATHFDIIIDDGCHLLSCIFKTYDNLAHLLTSTGVYIIEDWPPYYKEFEKTNPYIRAEFTSNGYRVCMVKDRAAGGGIEYLVIVYPPNSLAPMLSHCDEVT